MLYGATLDAELIYWKYSLKVVSDEDDSERTGREIALICELNDTEDMNYYINLFEKSNDNKYRKIIESIEQIERSGFGGWGTIYYKDACRADTVEIGTISWHAPIEQGNNIMIADIELSSWRFDNILNMVNTLHSNQIIIAKINLELHGYFEEIASHGKWLPERKLPITNLEVILQQKQDEDMSNR